MRVFCGLAQGGLGGRVVMGSATGVVLFLMERRAGGARAGQSKVEKAVFTDDCGHVYFNRHQKLILGVLGKN